MCQICALSSRYQNLSKQELSKPGLSKRETRSLNPQPLSVLVTLNSPSQGSNQSSTSNTPPAGKPAS
ncbi:MAG: hypothetical protein KME43_22460 [Myxacorys chilensis ATA2-1-KO14]|jgi:hypothetical protein|nr:hypothetical protein [Myxacorys chilensis ATA2-1-KO14]